MTELKLCPVCGKKPIVEHWSSGGPMYMVKCNNPDCISIDTIGYPSGHNLEAVKDEWNRRAGDG